MAKTCLRPRTSPLHTLSHSKPSAPPYLAPSALTTRRLGSPLKSKKSLNYTMKTRTHMGEQRSWKKSLLSFPHLVFSFTSHLLLFTKSRVPSPDPSWVTGEGLPIPFPGRRSGRRYCYWP